MFSRKYLNWSKNSMINNCSSVTKIKNFCSNVASNVFNHWENVFKKSKISEPTESIMYILSHILKQKKILNKSDVKNVVLNSKQLKEIEQLCHKRLKKMPIQYIIGEWDFREITLKMQEPVFIPRPETEQLVDLVLQEMRHHQLTSVLDLCCGSGAIGLSILREEPKAHVTAVDQSEEACYLTNINAHRLNLSSRLRLLKVKLDNKNEIFDKRQEFDVIVSNPPYVFTEDITHLEDEIKLYEDLKALDGGKNHGMNVIKSVLYLSSTLLKNKRKIFLEVDPRQPEIINNWLNYKKQLGLFMNKIHKDFNNQNRFVEITKLILK